ncbi:YLR414C-like protein [Saccharomyces cerevisiae x Saccharomyces kudriavzevii VIN7]|uniref:YLR414C-like protein n=1 Tax=Saccharomyces cerevisiae x Saccharomyces kudriavzevii (strain VIN7) TaxID=1095631 RepID=H0GYQ2_SACCK|nr:YLR414C-like protein [Saccharomyces cerevisiae x Saccharomyces kudriavzevii VIN7]
MRNFFTLFFAAIFSLGALVLAIVACAGSTKNYSPINKIYCAELDLSQMEVSTVLPSLDSGTLSSLGLPTYINIGLWSYCVEDSSRNVQSCSSPSGIQKFNLTSLIYDNIENNDALELIDSMAAVILPEKIRSKMTYYNNLVKCMFITMIIGIVLSFVSLVFNILRWIIHIRPLVWGGAFFSFFAFAALLVSIGSCLGTYLYIKHILKHDFSDYGIAMNIGRTYQGLMWGAVVGALFNFILWCSVRSRPNVIYANTPIEEKPLI